MRLIRPLPSLHRQCLAHSLRTYSTSSPSPSTLKALTSRPAKLIPDYLTPTPSHLLSTLLSDLLHSPSSSSPLILTPPAILPQGHHLVYFPIQTRPSCLAPDGADLDHSPGEPFSRRVWAGGEVVFNRGWRELKLDGRGVLCREVIRGAGVKGEGENGKVFVDVVRRYGVGIEEEREEWEIEEVRTLVFMRTQDASTSSSKSSPSPPRLIKVPYNPTLKTTLTPTPTHLFHFSALSFNAHSIHIDPLFAARDGHPALLVHGPLTLALMLRVLADKLGPGHEVRKFTYRNYAPLYVGEKLSVCVRPVKLDRFDVWVEGPGGGLAVRGTATVGRVREDEGSR